MKLLSNLFFIILIGALATSPAYSQGKDKNSKARPDLSGTWMLDRSKSNLGPSATPDQPLKIVHHDPEFRVTHQTERNGQISKRDFVYYTDDRGETNPTIMFLSTGTDMNRQVPDKDVTKSRTSWSGNKLVTRATLTSLLAGRHMEFEVIDEWKLSSDGKTLTQTSRTVFRQDASDGIFIPARRPDTKRVYYRIPD